MARKFEDEVTLIRIFKPDQYKMLEALDYILNIKNPNKNEPSSLKAALLKAKLNNHYSSRFFHEEREGLG